MSDNRSLQSAITDSENELFKILSRPNIQEMIRLHAEWEGNYRSQHNNSYPTTENIKFAEYYKWAWPEFLIQRHLYRCNRR